ncbi:alcohol dehydrogenase catalytic domain-containing protein [Streptomyces sp. 7R007]
MPAGCATPTPCWHKGCSLSVRSPMVLGHEGVGDVVAVGDGVTSRQVGD